MYVVNNFIYHLIEALIIVAADNTWQCFFYYLSQKIRLYISCESWQMIFFFVCFFFVYLESTIFSFRFLLPSMMTQEIDLFLTDRHDIAHSLEMLSLIFSKKINK